MQTDLTSKKSLRDREFIVVNKPTMVPAFEVLSALESYLVLSSVEQAIPEEAMALPDPVDQSLYVKYSERRKPYLRNDVEAQLPGNIRRLYGQVTDCLRGPDWSLSVIDPRFADSRDDILRELTTIGLTPAGWYYVVDNLPTDVLQLRVALLIIMTDKISKEWKDQAPTKLKRIVELVNRLRFLMQLSRKSPLERNALLDRLNVPDDGSPFSVSPTRLVISTQVPPIRHDLPVSASATKRVERAALESPQTIDPVTTSSQLNTPSLVKKGPFSSDVSDSVVAAKEKSDGNKRKLPDTVPSSSQIPHTETVVEPAPVMSTFGSASASGGQEIKSKTVKGMKQAKTVMIPTKASPKPKVETAKKAPAEPQRRSARPRSAKK